MRRCCAAFGVVLFPRRVALTLRCFAAFGTDPTINAKAFEAFPCYNFGPIDGQWLVADVSVKCFTPEHDRIQALAWLGIILYPVGWTATTGVLLYICRKPICGTAEKTDLSKALSFVYEDYESLYFWWELLEMFRRFFLVGLLSIINPGSITQLSIATLFSVLFLVLQLQAKPYILLANDYLALGGSLSLSLLYFCCVLLKVKVLTETEEVLAVLSPKLRQLFDIPVTALSITMLASIFGSLVFCGVLVVAVMRHQNHLRRKLRRLCFVRDNRFVELPPLGEAEFEHLPGIEESPCFHLFLSHAWPLGQDVCKLIKQRCREICPSIKVFLDVEDLVSGGGQREVDHSREVLVFAMPVYFEKVNCVKV